MNIDFKVGQQLKAIREAKGLSQTYVCKNICSVNSLSRIEANTQSPSFDLLFALCNRMGISLNTLIAAANYERHAFYYTLKDTIEALLRTSQRVRLKELLTLITPDIYQELPVVEQQFIDIVRVQVNISVDEDYADAHKLAKASLAKTFTGKNKQFYSSEELKLFNIIFYFERTPDQFMRVSEALIWLESQPESMKDYHAWLLLITGLMSYHYDRHEWHEALQYAMKGYDIALKEPKLNLLINFLFIRGMCLHQSNIDVIKGSNDIRAALQCCLQFGMSEVHNVLTKDMHKHQIKLKDNYN